MEIAANRLEMQLDGIKSISLELNKLETSFLCGITRNTLSDSVEIELEKHIFWLN